MIKFTFSRLLLAFTLFAAITSCKSSDKKDETSGDTLVNESSSPVEQPIVGANSYKEFDWNSVPASKAEIGTFPYITAPDGFYIQDGDHAEESKTGYSHLQDFNKLIIFNGNSFYNAEGKVGKLRFHMKSDNTDWNQYSFDTSIEKYMNSIGAKLVGKLKLSKEQEDFLNKDNDMTIYNHIVGDPYNDPVRFYALNHPSGKIMFQVFSNSASGDIGVVQLAAFEQTIKAPTAVQMKKDLDANGKAILNINFDTDKSNLQPDGQKTVDQILALMKNNSELKIAIEGHTDNAGSAERNKKLSADRSNTILSYLISKGIAAGRLSAAGFGAERPLVANDSEANMAKNRRVELVKR